MSRGVPEPASAPSDGGLGVTLAGPAEAGQWDRFLAGHAEASVCHLFGWKAVFETAYRKRCHYLCALRRGEIEGVLPLVWMGGPIGGRRLVSLPYLDRGGPVAGSPAADRALLLAGRELATRLRATGIDLHSSGGDAPATDEPRRCSLVLALGQSEEALWKAIGPKVRNQIRKSEKADLETAAAGPDEIGSFHEVYARNMRDLGAPMHSRRFFAEILRVFASAAQLFLTRDAGGRVVAGGLALRFAGRVTVPWASALRSARPSCPNHSLYWRVLRHALAAGATEFDFGRSNVGAGTYHFKKQWGTTVEALTWVSSDRHGEFGPERTTSPRLRSTVAGAWSRLPVPVAVGLSGLVRKHLAI